MAIRVSCTCSKQLKLKDALAGKRVKCPACGNGIAVPDPGNGSSTNGRAHAPAVDNDKAFEFDSPAMESAPAPAADVMLSVPAEGLKSPVAASESPTPAKKGRAALLAILAVFLLVVTGLVVAVVHMMSGGNADPDDPDGKGAFAHKGNEGDKLTLEKEQAKLRMEAEAAHKIEVAAQKKADDAAKLEAEEKARKKKVADDEKLIRENAAEVVRLKKVREDAEKLRIVQARQRTVTAQKLVVEGQKAMAAGQPDKAKLAFEQANKLDPANKDAKGGLAKATQEVNKIQNKIKFDRLVAAGQKNLQDKKYDLAVSSLKLAIELNPDDAAAADALKKAEAAKRKLDAELERFLGRGYRALKRHEFVVAGKAFDDADKFAPGHPKVVAAKQALVNEKNRLRAEAEAKKKQEEERRLQLKKDKEDFEKYVAQGRAALKAKKFNEALRDLTLATKLVPDDQVAKGLLRQAREALAKAGEAERRKRLAEEMRNRKEAREKVAALIKTGKKALDDKLYQEAVNSLGQANVLIPGDKVVLALLKKANKGLEEQRLASTTLRQKADDARKAEQARKLFAQARQALRDKNYDRTDQLIADLVKLVPNDPDVLGLRQDVLAARKAIADENARLAAEKARMEAEAARKKLLAAFDAKMKSGATALAAKKFDAAITAYSDGLKMVEKQKALAAQEKQARAAIEEANKAKDRADKLKLKLSQ
jgi:hypothetical protein